MPKRYLLNACIEFYPVEHQLVAYGSQNLSIVLNAPVSRCLQLLIERRYTLVPQQEFYPYVWGEMGSSIPVSTLYQNIALLRKALKAFVTSGEKMITTVPKQGVFPGTGR
ncbi:MULTISPECIES: winged helix-turn-helix domain-containing protein [unclassified Serratia (in: enterobacteria)]|uniref:winged helix-turn-helix domain-containing protein n=1 Tax=unclassified Serratia (in: enterobacteria) TaxID=2647522 RepID=UPI000468F20D|nr:MULTISPECIES: winged helix-turn-helix domain-containing protein [unclassified Serratia (in: enterobacteria)]